MSNSITQDIQYKQTVVEYSYRHGVTSAAIKFKMYRKTIYRWRERYDGTAKSLINKSRRPHGHPNQHTTDDRHRRTSAFRIDSYHRTDNSSMNHLFRGCRCWSAADSRLRLRFSAPVL